MSNPKILKNHIFIGDAEKTLHDYIASDSVDCCITSPPYYQLRDYGMDEQIGMEDTVDEYIDKLVRVFNLVHYILKPTGTLWLNIADTYAEKFDTENDIKRKDMCLIPYRLILALQQSGWYVRQDIIWNKTNCIPESVKDRCTRSHEYLFLLSKSPDYYFDANAIREPLIGNNNDPVAGSKGTLSPNTRRRGGRKNGKLVTYNNSDCMRNKRDVWNIPTQGSKDVHFATFPEALVEPCLLAGCPEGGIVLDPFFGSGTVGVVAVQNDRNYIGIELNPEYAEYAQKRIDTAQQKEGILYSKQDYTDVPDNTQLKFC